VRFTNVVLASNVLLESRSKSEAGTPRGRDGPASLNPSLRRDESVKIPKTGLDPLMYIWIVVRYMSRSLEEKIRGLCDQAVQAETPDDVGRLTSELHSAINTPSRLL
jgi:hypothetical protein